MNIYGEYMFVKSIYTFLTNINFEAFFKKRGLYVSSADKDKWRLQLMVHANYDDPIKVPKYVYHVATMNHIEDTLKNGLKVRSGNKLTHDLPRVYIALDKTGTKDIIDAFQNWDIYNSRNQTDRIIFRIDTTKLRKGTKFFSDEDFKPLGAWTYTNIPAKAISLVTGW